MRFSRDLEIEADSATASHSFNIGESAAEVDEPTGRAAEEESLINDCGFVGDSSGGPTTHGQTSVTEVVSFLDSTPDQSHPSPVEPTERAKTADTADLCLSGGSSTTRRRVHTDEGAGSSKRRRGVPGPSRKPEALTGSLPEGSLGSGVGAPRRPPTPVTVLTAKATRCFRSSSSHSPNPPPSSSSRRRGPCGTGTADQTRSGVSSGTSSSQGGSSDVLRTKDFGINSAAADISTKRKRATDDCDDIINDDDLLQVDAIGHSAKRARSGSGILGFRAARSFCTIVGAGMQSRNSCMGEPSTILISDEESEAAEGQSASGLTRA